MIDGFAPDPGPDIFGAEWTLEQLQSFLLFTDNQDMDAINRFISDTVAVTPRAIELKDQWIHWWDDLNFWEKNVSTETYDEARNRRNAFILANQMTEQAKKDIERVIKEGIETEESEGRTRRMDSTGKFNAPSSDEEKPFFPSWLKVGAGVALLSGAALGIAKIVGGFNPVAIAMRFKK